MRIERIEKSKHKQERVLVFLEGGDLLRITGAELLRFGLYKGMDLSPALVVELQAAAQQSQLKQTAARMASGRMLSKKEVQHRLTKKGATEEQAADTADWLETLGAVDDEGYAGVIVRHYGAMGYGPGRVKQELHRRGVPRELWDEALAQLPPAADAVRKVVERAELVSHGVAHAEERVCKRHARHSCGVRHFLTRGNVCLPVFVCPRKILEYCFKRLQRKSVRVVGSHH